MAIFDLYDGSLYRIETDEGDFDVTLSPGGSLLVICGQEAREAVDELPAVLGSGASFADFSTIVPIEVVNSFECELLDENVLPLNDFALEMNGEKVYDGPVCGSWHTHFYPAPDGTPFRATYTFISDCEVAGSDAVIEVAENLDRIIFNSSELLASKRSGEFRRVRSPKELGGWQLHQMLASTYPKGHQHFGPRGRKVNNITGMGSHNQVADWTEHRPTEAEEVYIIGRFAVDRIADGLYGITSYHRPSVKNLTNDGFPFYCGRIKVRAEFDLPFKPIGRLMLGLNGASMASASVRINGEVCGNMRWKPHVLDITKAVMQGHNAIEIDMSTTLVNAFGPNRRAGIKEITCVGPNSFVEMDHMQSNYELFEFGFDSAAIYHISSLSGIQSAFSQTGLDALPKAAFVVSGI